MRKIFNILLQNNLVSWETLYVGWSNNWIGKEEIVEFALNEIEHTRNEYVIMIAGSSNDTSEEVKNYLSQIIDKEYCSKNESLEIQKWLLGALIRLSNEKISEEKKILKLEEIYADFKYPKEMARCSMYYIDSNSNTDDRVIDPLVEMKKLIIILNDRFK